MDCLRAPAPSLSSQKRLSRLPRKAILRRADNAMIVMAVAFEIENSIDDMFECFRAGDRTVLCDVSSKKHRCRRLLGKCHKVGRDISNLRYAARSGFDPVTENRLDRINNEKIGPQFISF